jgi:hypothetical protein
MRGILEGAIAGALAAPAYAGATSSADVSQPQSSAPMRLSTRNASVTFDGGRVKRVRCIIPSGAGCIVDRSGFDLRQPQHIEYISCTLARPRDIGEISVRGLPKTKRLQVRRRRGVNVLTRGFLCCVAVALAVSWTRPALALDPRYPDWPCRQLKVPGISIANVWHGPSIEPIDTTNPPDPKEADLISRLAARRTPMEEARQLITDFVVGTRQEKQEKATRLFAASSAFRASRRAWPRKYA